MRAAISFCAGPIVLAAMSTPAAAQRGGWAISASAEATPSSPVVDIRVYAWFERVPELAEMFEAGAFDLRAAEPSFLDYRITPGIMGNPNAIVAPTSINWVSVWQFHHPPEVYGNPASPLLVSTARWMPTTFTPRYVTLRVVNRAQVGFTVFRSVNGTQAILVQSPEGDDVRVLVRGDCYADCDTSTGTNVLDIFDFLCFQNFFAAGEPYACDCDTGTGPGVCDIFDFLCFQNEFVRGCP